MTTEVKLPNDQTAIFLDSDELSNRDVKALRRAARKVGLVGQKLQDLGMEELREEQKADDDDTEEDEAVTSARNRKALSIFSQLDDSEDDALDLFQRVATVVRLVSWTVKNKDGSDRALPETPEDVDDLPRPIYAILTTEAAKLDLTEDFSLEGAQDPKAPTDNSEDSAVLSVVENS